MGIEKTGVLIGIGNGKGKLPKIYFTWAAMKQRCFNKNEKGYKNWGGRGITVCDRWLDFENFYNDMDKSMESHIKKYGTFNTSLDRVDNNGNYCKENCRWATQIEQSNNRRLNNLIEYRGESKTIIAWSRVLGIKDSLILSRIKNGISFTDAIKYKSGKRFKFRLADSKKDFILKFIDYLYILPKRSKKIIIYRFGINDNKIKSLRETGDKFNISKQRVQMIIDVAMEKMAKAREKTIKHLTD